MPKFKVGDPVRYRNRVYVITSRARIPDVARLQPQGKKSVGCWIYGINDGSRAAYDEESFESLIQCPNCENIGFDRVLGCENCGISPEDLQ